MSTLSVAEEELQFGDWMKANEALWQPGTPRVRYTPFADREVPRGRPYGYDRGRRSAGRFARGRAHFPNGYAGQTSQWKEKEPKEATSQESRKRNLEEADFGYEKEDELGDTTTSPTKPTVTGRVEEGKEKPDAQKKLAMGDVLAEKQTPSMVPPPPPKYISPREQKRSKREGKGKQVQEDEAGSLEECRRAQ